MNFVKLSKTVSYALRHAPEDYNIALDEDGWANIDALLSSIRTKHLEYRLIIYDDLLAMLGSNEKRRHEIDGRKIRALYGHSVAKVIKKECAEPPTFLYHGTSSRNFEVIRKEGLKKMDRQYVHLSSDTHQAADVAARKTRKPIILKVRASDAALSGIKFYKEGAIWLCDFLPSIFIEIESRNENFL